MLSRWVTIFNNTGALPKVHILLRKRPAPIALDSRWHLIVDTYI